MLDNDGQPTQRIIDDRRKAQFISPIPKPKKRSAKTDQQQFVFDEGKGLSTTQQQYDPTPIINELRHYVDQWRSLIVEIKGYRGEDAKDKKSTMDTYWIPGVNQLKTYGRWAFAEFTDIYEIESDFAAKVESQFNEMLMQTTTHKDCFACRPRV